MFIFSLLPDIRLDWRTFNVDKKDHKLVDLVVAYGEAFPVKDIDGNVVRVRPRAWEGDQTPDSVVTSSSLQSLSVSAFTTAICGKYKNNMLTQSHFIMALLWEFPRTIQIT